MRISFTLLLLPLGTLAFAFKNGPGTSLGRGRRTNDYVPVIELSEDRINKEIGVNSSAINPYVREKASKSTSPNPANRQIFKKRQDTGVPTQNTGAVTCTATTPCIDDSCCGPDGKCGFKDEHCGAGCTSHCDAKPMCGKLRDGSEKSCGLNICCSFFGWCGTKSVHCLDPEPQFGVLPCQSKYGKCELINPPECGTGGGDLPKKIAYYQGWNSRTRTCDQVYPKNINTKGLTHLMYSFVGFDPSTFEIVADAADIPLFPEFTKLKTSTLSTWVAVGGWSFNDPGATFTAFSDMVSTSGNRAKFIKSLIAFMDKYGFTGADIDWEYPSEPKRGGKAADKQNLVELLKDMRAAFGTKYGLSAVLAPDYWYLQGFAPAQMAQYVDHLGFMAYDLHGPWDSENALGSRIRPHTDIREIDNGLTPLWYDGVDPKKIVLGLAYYGRTYTAASADCAIMGCTFSGPGKAYGCTNFGGVLSNMEIRRIIKETGAKPTLLSGAMVKELVWDKTQWVGYDDEETIALKTDFAKKRCLGGTMIWSIDYDSNDQDNGGSSNGGSNNGGSNNGGTGGNVPALPSESKPLPKCLSGRDDTVGPAHRCIFCGDKDVNDDRKYGPEKWAAALGDNAVKWTHIYYKQYRILGKLEAAYGAASSYVRSISYDFNGPSLWECSLGITATCSNVVPCGDSKSAAVGATGNPAISMMMTSWAHIKTFYTNLHLALLGASTNVEQNVGEFASTFSPPIADGTKALKIMLDIISLGYGTFAATAWNGAMTRAFKSQNSEQHGITKDTSNTVVQSMITIGKDTLTAPPSPLGNQNKLSSALSVATQRFMKAIDVYVKEIFSGSDAGLDAMAVLLKNGKWLDPAVAEKSIFDIQKDLQRVLFGMLLTKAWTLDKFVQPYIIRIEKEFSYDNPTKLKFGGNTPDIKDSDIADGRVFVEGETYILIDMHACEERVPDADNFYQCVRGFPRPIAGIKSLIDAPEKWGKIGKEDIVTSAVQGWKLNGGRNGYVMPDQSKHIDGKGTLSEMMFENGIRTPGFFSFPICGYEEAKLAWIRVYGDDNKDKCSTWPCCVYK